MKKNNKKGFTLAELLVVVGIIAILVAIAIPTFGAATDRAYAGVLEANARSAYGEWMIDYVATNTKPTKNDTITYTTGGKTTTCTLTDVAEDGNGLKLTIHAKMDKAEDTFYFSSNSNTPSTPAGS